MNRLLLALLLSLTVLMSCTVRGGEEPEDDDDATGDDDDFTFEDPPVFLASYDFTFVMLENEISGDYSAIHGQMDVSVSATAFLAEMSTTDGEQWDLGGSLTNNAQSFQVRGWMTPPGVGKEIFVEVVGNFLADVDGTPSESCLTGLGADDDPNFADQGIEFVWYGCQLDAAAPAIDRAGSHNVTVTVNGDLCGAWTSGSWVENWSFDGRKLTVTRNSYVGWGIVSDDGNIFRFTMLEQENPGRSLKVVGDFTDPAGTTEATAQGFCHDNPGELIAASLFLDY